MIRSLPFLAAAAALLSVVAGAGCTAGAATSPSADKSGPATSPSPQNADCQSPGSNGIANYSLGGPCGISGPTSTGTVNIAAHVKVNPHRQLSFQLAGSNAHLFGSYDQCSCAADTSSQGGQSYATYQPCDPSADTSGGGGGSTFGQCTTTFENTVSATIDASTDGIVTLQLMDGTDVLEQFSFEVATPASIDVKAVSGASGAPTIEPDTSGVYQVHLSDQTVALTPRLLTKDGRTLTVGGGRASLAATFSDSRVLASDSKVTGGQVGIRLTGAGDATVKLTDGANLTRVLKFHVSS